MLKKFKEFFHKRKKFDSLLEFEIKQRKELEIRVSRLEKNSVKIKDDVSDLLESKIHKYKHLFTATKEYGDKLLKIKGENDE